MGGYYNIAEQGNYQEMSVAGVDNFVGQAGSQSATVAPFDFGAGNYAGQGAYQGALVVGDDNIVGQTYDQDTAIYGFGNTAEQGSSQTAVIW